MGGIISGTVATWALSARLALQLRLGLGLGLGLGLEEVFVVKLGLGLLGLRSGLGLGAACTPAAPRTAVRVEGRARGMAVMRICTGMKSLGGTHLA